MKSEKGNEKIVKLKHLQVPYSSRDLATSDLNLHFFKDTFFIETRGFISQKLIFRQKIQFYLGTLNPHHLVVSKENSKSD